MTIERIFSGLATSAVRRPRAVVGLALAALALAGWAAATRLPIRTSNLDLIDQHLPEVRRFLDFADAFGTPNVLVVALEGEDEAALRAAVDRLGPRLRELPGVRSVLDRVPCDPAVLSGLDTDPYLAAADRRLFLVFVQPLDARSRADTISPLVDHVRRVIKEEDLARSGVRAGLTGIPIYAIDDRDVIRRDITRLSFLSLGLIAALFVASFRSVRRPLLAVATLLAAVLATTGLVAIYPGHITLLSAFFASTLFGLGIDYGIHIINRVEECMADGRPEREAIPPAVAAQARELSTAAATTAFGFFAMSFSGFRGFAELGVIAGAGVLVCLFAMVTLLPALLVLVPGRPARARPFESRRLGRFLIALQHPAWAGALAVVAFAGLAVKGPGFDSDYLNLEPRDSEAVRLERAIAERSDYSTQFAVFVTGSRRQAEALADRAMDDETAGDVRSIADLDLLQEADPRHAPFPDYFLRGFVSTGGQYAVYVYPAGDVWNPQVQQRFLSHMRALDASVTGMPFLGSFMVARSQRALYITSALAGLLLLMAVSLDLRRPLLVALAVLPTVLTVIALRGLMTLFGLPLNPLNVMALPIVIGIAVDNGVYIVHRYLAEGGDLARTLAGTGRSVLMTSATTLAGFGALAFTAHRGLASFAMILSLGVGSALVISLMVLPQALRLLLRPGAQTPRVW